MPVIQKGSKGPDVLALQQRLKDLGFDPNGVDGNFGPGTEAAVRAFQQAKGLGVDGKVGPNTSAALLAGSASGGETPGGTGSEASSGTVNPANVTTPATAGGLNLTGLSGKLPDFVITQIPATAAEFGITSNLRLAHFLAQCALESTGFTATVENLNYSAGRIPQVFGKYFRNVDPAGYAHNPQKLGSRVYANRMGNGDDSVVDPQLRVRGVEWLSLFAYPLSGGFQPWSLMPASSVSPSVRSKPGGVESIGSHSKILRSSE
jgi:putative chitinase